MLLLSRTLRRLVGAVVLLAVLWVAATAATVWWTARQDDRTASDVIVVLGASQANGRPLDVLSARLDHAKTLYDAGVAPVVVTIGGGLPGDNFTEGAAGKQYLQERGVSDVVSIGEGRNTLGSLQALSARMRAEGWDSAVLVTDPWHSLRSRTMARDLGLDAVASPTRSGPSVSTRGIQARYIARETAALVFYQAFQSWRQ